MNNNYKLLMFNLLIMSNLFIISSNSWFNMWMWLEINLISFISINLNFSHFLSIETSIIYFIIQAIASTIFIFSIIMFMYFNYMMNLIFFSLILKMGIPPFHYWLMLIINKMNWFNIFIILTWQKLSPMIIFMQLNISMKYYNMYILFLISIGSILALNFISIKNILLYSSINQLSWLLISCFLMNKIWKIYFLMYLMMMMIIIIFLYNMSMNYMFNSFNLKYSINMFMYTMMIINFMSLMGIPPFLGFLPKLMMIMIFNKNFLLYLLIIFSFVASYYYLRIFFNLFFINMIKINNYNLMFINKIMMLFSLIMHLLTIFLLFI